MVKICEVVDGCEDCPKYGDDCDGDKMTEHTDLISRADAIDAIELSMTAFVFDEMTIKEVLQAIADNTKEIAISRIKHLPSADAVEVKAEQLPPKVPTEWLNDGMVLVPQHDWIEMQKKLEEYVSADAVPQSEQYKKGFEDAKRAYEIELARSADAVQGWRIGRPTEQCKYMVTLDSFGHKRIDLFYYGKPMMPNRKVRGKCWYRSDDEWGDVVYDDKEILAWQPLPTPYKGGDTE